MKKKLTEKQKELIEKFANVQVKFGLTPAAARVNALLITIEDEGVSFDEIREALHLSKSATSNAISSLLMMNYIEFKTVLGDRKRYFNSKLDQWKDKFRKDVLAIEEYNSTMKEILLQRSDVGSDYYNKIVTFNEFLMHYVSDNLRLIETWRLK